MKLEAIKIENLFGIASAALPMSAPVVMIAGKVGAGKTSIQHAIRLALSGDLCRVTAKKDARDIIHGDAKAGQVDMAIDGAPASARVTASKVTATNSLPPKLEAVYALTTGARRPGKMSPDDLRTAILRAIGYKRDPQRMAADLIADGHSADRVAELVPQTASGFAAGATYAASRATEARGAWSEVTGERYGAQKAEAWEPPLNADAGDPEERAAKVESTEAEFREAESKARAAEAAAAAINAGIRSLQTKPPEPPALKLIDRIADALAECMDAMDDEPNPAWIDLLDEYERVGRRAPRDPAPAEWAPDTEAIAKATEEFRAAGAKARHEREAADFLAQALRAAQSLHATAVANAGNAARKARAAELHAEASAWSALADALSPGGYPARELAAAVQPLQDRMALSCEDMQWPTVRLDLDTGELTRDGRPYRLLSTGERWQCDLICTEAIAYASGVRMMIVDGLDILVPSDRSRTLSWLQMLAESGELHCAIVMCTLGKRPAADAVPDGVGLYWVESGRTHAITDGAAIAA